jgi:hypothetical protein
MSVASLAASVGQPSSPKLSKRKSIERWKKPDYSMVDLFRSLCKDQRFETLLNVKLRRISKDRWLICIGVPEMSTCNKYTHLTRSVTPY